MPLNLPFAISMENLFMLLYNAKTENDVAEIMEKQPEIFDDKNWKPLGGNENMLEISNQIL
jgi:hypothetical protein